MQFQLRDDFMWTSSFALWMRDHASQAFNILEGDVGILLQILSNDETREDRRRLEGAAESAARALGMAIVVGDIEAVLVFQSALSIIHDGLDRIYMSEEG